jgi:hypothetical protein
MVEKALYLFEVAVSIKYIGGSITENCRVSIGALSEWFT